MLQEAVGFWKTENGSSEYPGLKEEDHDTQGSGNAFKLCKYPAS